MIENYIFDLYGTLVDIHTDQNKKNVWKTASRFYLGSGAVWTPGKMHKAYRRICLEEEQKLAAPDIQYPEIDLGTVFQRLYEEAPFRLPFMNRPCTDEWIREAAALFRKASREKLYPYRNSVTVLKQLKREGKGVWLLSNAQTLFTEDELKMCGLYDLFDGIYISSDKGVKKPQKEFLEMMLAEYGIPKETALMIGNDIRADIGIACACGVKSVFLNTSHMPAEQIEKQLADTVKDPSYRPVLIMSGDLGELPGKEREYA